MSKTTPEEAKAIADKHGVCLHPFQVHRFERLAALIDEVRAEKALEHVSLFGELQNALEEIERLRGVDAEPVEHQFQDREGHWCPFADDEHYKNTVKDGSWPIRALYTHPAPSQPAAPVELPVVAIISCYAIPTSDGQYADEILIQRTRQIEGPPLWSVRLNGDCLNKSGEWEREPMPSSRDDEFLERCRFSTAQEAINAAIAAGRKAS